MQLACNIRVAPEPFVPLARALLRSRISSLSFGTAFTIALRSDQDCITQMESGRKLRYSSSIARPTLERYAFPFTLGLFSWNGSQARYRPQPNSSSCFFKSERPNRANSGSSGSSCAVGGNPHQPPVSRIRACGNFWRKSLAHARNSPVG